MLQSGGAPVLFLYKGGRSERLVGHAPYPSEFFYGARELACAGRRVEILDEGAAAQLAGAVDARTPATRIGAMAHWLARTFAPGFPAIVASHLWRRPVRDRLAAARAIVATANGQAVSLGALRRVGALRRPVFAIAMGALLAPPRGAETRLLAWALSGCRVLSLSRSEAARLSEWLGIYVGYLPFGVDADFWTPGAPGEVSSIVPDLGPGYALAIGNDRHRDFETLVSAWKPEFPMLVLVTERKLPPLPSNVRAISGNWSERLIADVDVRALVRGASFAVVPLHPTIQPSGQSATLQAMACGKPVILSDTDGLWDRAAMRDGTNCRLVPSGDADALARAVEEISTDADARARMGAAARDTVLATFTIGRMADALAAEIEAANV